MSGHKHMPTLERQWAYTFKEDLQILLWHNFREGGILCKDLWKNAPNAGKKASMSLNVMSLVIMSHMVAVYMCWCCWSLGWQYICVITVYMCNIKLSDCHGWPVWGNNKSAILPPQCLEITLGQFVGDHINSLGGVWPNITDLLLGRAHEMHCESCSAHLDLNVYWAQCVWAMEQNLVIFFYFSNSI